MHTTKTSLKRNQRGLASILVTMILMMIISLIVIGLARLSRREQRQTLDDQLSTQAFYAAESGVNDAVKKLNTPGAVNLANNYASDCNSFMTDTGLSAVNTLDSGAGVKYTCLLVDPHPGDLEFDPVPMDRSVSTVLKAHYDPAVDNYALIDSLHISWEDAGGSKDVSGCRSDLKFPPQASWPANCNTGILRVDIVAVNVYSNFSRDDLMQNTITLFLYPQASGGLDEYSVYWLSTGVPGYSPDKVKGAIVPVNCDGTGPKLCTLNITKIPGDDGFPIRLRSIYRISNVNIVGDYSGVETTNFEGSQIKIDATGKANDVLRRIQVRVPANPLGPFPDFAIQSGDTICKKLQIAAASPFTASNNGPAGLDACDPFR